MADTLGSSIQSTHPVRRYAGRLPWFGDKHMDKGAHFSKYDVQVHTSRDSKRTGKLVAAAASALVLTLAGAGCRRNPPAGETGLQHSSSPPSSSAQVVPVAKPATASFANGSCGADAAHAAAAEYRRQWDDIQARPGQHSLEPLFRAGNRAADLFQLPCGHSSESVLDSATEAERKRIAEAMPGYDIAGEAGQALQPNLDVFADLAAKKGAVDDKVFFSLFRDSRQPNGFPSYVQQQTDYSGCTDYATGTLTRLYLRWQAFPEKSQTYREEARQWQENLEREFTSNDCACGDRDSVIREFELLLGAQPNAPIAPPVRKRLEELRKDQVAFRYNCTPS